MESNQRSQSTRNEFGLELAALFCPVGQIIPLTYVGSDIQLRVNRNDKPIVWLKGEVKTPPFSQEARIEAGTLLRRLQQGESIGLPHSRPMPSIGKRCHELRITDENVIWRIIYRLDSDAVIIGEIFPKKTQQTPKKVIDICKARFKKFDGDIK